METWVLNFLKSKSEFEIIDQADISKADYAVVIGGDGTLLRAFRKIKNKKTKVVAINSGTLGYLTEIRKDKYKEIFKNIFMGFQSENNRWKNEKLSV